MQRIDENRISNYVKKHTSFKKWLAFALCLSLLTGTLTLYLMNKPATAMTEEGSESVGLVLETADSEFEQSVIQQTLSSGTGSGGGTGEEGALLSTGTDEPKNIQQSGDGTSDGGSASSSTASGVAASGNSSTGASEGSLAASGDAAAADKASAGASAASSAASADVAAADKSSAGASAASTTASADASSLMLSSTEGSPKTDTSFNSAATTDITEFTYEDEEVIVKAVTNSAGVLPEGTSLKVTAVDKDTTGYNYDAYMEALNNNAE